MPLIAYKCNCGHEEKKYVRQVKDIPAFFLCPKCNTENLKKAMSAPSSGLVLTVDNGVQARSVDIRPDILEINKARSEKDYREE